MTKAFDDVADRLAGAIAYADGDTNKGQFAFCLDFKAIRAMTKCS